MGPVANFEDIYQEFQPRIRRYLRHLVGNSEADDLTQIVFLKINAALPGFRGDASLSTWIYRIATNVARDHARSRGKWNSVDGETIEALPDPAQEAADRAYIRREMNNCIRELVDRLPEPYRAVLLLSDFEDFSNAQIVEVLDLSLDTVKIRLHRARARLREAMQCQCSFYRDDGNDLMCDRKPEK
jgi:RNA polymerase sigma-70 factor (ECF subfamily)